MNRLRSAARRTHELVETGGHAGHLDAARDLLDGCTWDYAQGGLADFR